MARRLEEYAPEVEGAEPAFDRSHRLQGTSVR